MIVSVTTFSIKFSQDIISFLAVDKGYEIRILEIEPFVILFLPRLTLYVYTHIYMYSLRLGWTFQRWCNRDKVFANERGGGRRGGGEDVSRSWQGSSRAKGHIFEVRRSLILCDSAFYPIQSIIHRCSPLCRIYYPATCLHQKFAPRVSVFVLDEIRIHRIRDKLNRPICRYALPPNILLSWTLFRRTWLIYIKFVQIHPFLFFFLLFILIFSFLHAHIYIYKIRWSTNINLPTICVF